MQHLHDELVQLTCELVAIESIDSRPDQLHAVIDYAEAFIKSVPNVSLERLTWNDKPNLVVSLRGNKTPKVVLNAHLDVVPGRPEQFRPEIRNGRIYGRGTQDMKGSAAVLLCLLRDLAALPERPDVGFQFVSDEEIGGNDGTGQLAAAGYTCDFFLAAEPTDLQICNLQKGAAWIDVVLTGQPAHGSRPWDGVNALAMLRDGLVALEKHYPSPDEAAWVTTVTPTVVQGGAAGNRLPDKITLTLDVRYVPGDSPQQVHDVLSRCFPEADVQLLRWGPPLSTPANDPGIAHLSQVTGLITKTPAPLYREHYASDARFYSDLGIPSVCFGPVGAGLHSDEEWVDSQSLVQLYQILERFVR
jgi:succinyl-diaminopimelate desuccinylase